MRVIPVVVLLLMVSPQLADAQSFEVHASAGPTITDPGYSLAAGAGFSPTKHLTAAFNVERTYLSSRTTSDGRGGVSGFRGGTLVLGSGELRPFLLQRGSVLYHFFFGEPRGLDGIFSSLLL